LAIPTSVNSQITDAVIQANTRGLDEPPAEAIGKLYQSISQAIGIAVQDAVSAQQQANVIYQAATTMGVSLLYTVDTRGKVTTDTDVEAYLEAILEEHRSQKAK